jgi:hypothetical protein
VLAQAYLLVLLGQKLDFTLKMGEAPFIHPDARLIQIDHDAAVLELTQRNAHNRPLLLLEQGDPEAVLTQLGRQIENSPPISPQWANGVSQGVSFRPPEWNKIHTSKGEAIHPAEVGRAIDQFLSEGEPSLLIVDGGEFFHWMRASVHTSNRLSNGAAGCIGGVIPERLQRGLLIPKPESSFAQATAASAFTPLNWTPRCATSCHLWSSLVTMRSYTPSIKCNYAKDSSITNSNHSTVALLVWGQCFTADLSGIYLIQ